MPKTNYQSPGEKVIAVFFQAFVFLSLLSPLWVFKDLLFPFITSKAFSFRIFVELALPFYLYLLVARPSLRPSLRNPVVVAGLAFLVINFVSAFFGVNPTRGLWGNFERMGGAYYLAHLVLLSFYIILLSQMGGAYIKRMLYGALAVAAFITLNGISGWMHGPIVVPDPSLPTRVSSTLGNPIFLGSFLILPMFLAAFFALQEETLWKKVLFWILVLLQFVGIVLSVTRGAVVGLAAGLFLGAVVYIVFSENRKVKIFSLEIVAVFLIAIAALFMFRQKLPQDKFYTRIFHLDDSTSQARLIQWRTALDGFKDAKLLGVGPENYYVIANKYYNPEIIKYDPSWFDKPHNYVLEVLVTTGALGFLAYMSLVIFVALAFYRAFKAGLLSALQMALLLAGFVSYFVQNLFVFDTIPASMMFYVFVGFSAFLWQESAQVEGTPLKAKNIYTPDGFGWAVFLVSGVVVLYSVYATNYLPAKAAKDVNYGFAYAAVNPQKALDYFNAAKDSPFNFDLQDTAQRFSESINNIVQQQPGLGPDAQRQALNDATAFQKQVAEQINNDPVSWQKLAADYYILSFFAKTQLGPNAEQAAQKAVALAPYRLEPQYFLAQMYLQEGKTAEAQNLLEHISSTLPQTAYTASARWLLGGVYHAAGQDDRGVALINSLLKQGFAPQSSADVLWALDYYFAQKNYPAMKDLAEQSVKALPNDADLYLELAKAYAKTGQVQDAKDLLQKMLNSTPPNKQAVEDLLKTLK